MAEFLYGHVYFHDRFAGMLRQEPGDRCSFTYDGEFLLKPEAISISLPPQTEAYVYPGRLHPFFDNLLAEGRLGAVQAGCLGVPVEDRFARLLAFGGDCIGAVTVCDPKPRLATGEMPESAEDIASIASRASISGVQAKLLAVQTETGFRPAQAGELSTHIAKLPSGNHREIVQLEQLSTLAARILLPDDEVAELQIAAVKGIAEGCLLIRRFDRPNKGGAILKRHFEEFNKILGHTSEDKYTGKYADMADVLRLSPFYDVLAAALYTEYSRTGMALQLGPGTNPTSLADIGQPHLIALANSFGMRSAALREATQDLGRRIETAQDAVREAPNGSRTLKSQLADYMRKRWNGTFKQIISSTGRKS